MAQFGRHKDCRVCGKVFNTFKEMREHMDKVHAV